MSILWPNPRDYDSDWDYYNAVDERNKMARDAKEKRKSKIIDVAFYDIGYDSEVAYGRVIDDDRWIDGTEVRTSIVVKKNHNEDGVLTSFETLNTIYEVITND